MIMKWVRRDEWKTEKLPVGIENFKQSTKNYARTFQPTMSWDEYIAGMVQETMFESAISALLRLFWTQLQMRH